VLVLLPRWLGLLANYLKSSTSLVIGVLFEFVRMLLLLKMMMTLISLAMRLRKTKRQQRKGRLLRSLPRRKRVRCLSTLDLIFAFCESISEIKYVP